MKKVFIAFITFVLITSVMVFLIYNSQLQQNQPREKEAQPSANREQKELPPQKAEEVTVEFVSSKYKTVPIKPKGWFTTGQDADIMLSGIDFNNTGGALLFNHPKGIATDGARLLLADTYNNRILIWNKIPHSNQPPDLVLGQKNFISNNPGTELDELNWPVSVATDGKRIVVADTENDRILIWNSFPTRNEEKADIVLGEKDFEDTRPEIGKNKLFWPAALDFDGSFLWVGEFKFSGRILRFSVRESWIDSRL